MVQQVSCMFVHTYQCACVCTAYSKRTCLWCVCIVLVMYTCVLCVPLCICDAFTAMCIYVCTFVCVWSFRVSERYSWKLDRTENFSRMRMKLIRSYPCNPHTDASIMRDEGGLGKHLRRSRLELIVMSNLPTGCSIGTYVRYMSVCIM